MAAVIYVLEYAYAHEFLAAFGVSPEEVGIDQIKLVTRAGVLALLLLAGLGGFIVAAGALRIIVRDAVNRVKVFRGVRNRVNVRQKARVVSRTRGSTHGRAGDVLDFIEYVMYARDVYNETAPPPAAVERGLRVIECRVQRDKEKQRRLGRCIFLLLLLVVVFVVAAWLQETAAFAVGQRLLLVVPFWFACYVIWFDLPHQLHASVGLGVAWVLALSWSAAEGGGRQGERTAKTGHAPVGLLVAGLDIVPVTPTWLNIAAAPKDYHNEDLLELGSDGGTVFLYDCRASMTYRVSLADVVLTYSVRKPMPVRNLRCR